MHFACSKRKLHTVVKSYKTALAKHEYKGTGENVDHNVHWYKVDMNPPLWPGMVQRQHLEALTANTR